ncbi:DNA polymerase III subunit epsilon [Algicola sagamiensis]|uniref:DNA polymerase III subunit epsilon n=1 Tax=Algicola sagamiensis TaxID=163869 RepID=UPI00036FC195|nr:DNA polymerase III subunit epsilon [Algicola sagamiensis]
MRQIVLDTETTGFDPKQGHRMVEVGCVEMIDRKFTGNNFHVYIDPERYVDDEVIGVHGITNEFLVGKPKFRDVAAEFFEYMQGAELVIHNAAFDVGFIEHEFKLLYGTWGPITEYCQVLDTLMMARKMHPGQKNTLDALCRRYGIDNSHRTLHGALLDSEILADVYLRMTGGQFKMNWQSKATEHASDGQDVGVQRYSGAIDQIPVIKATEDELSSHEERLELVLDKGGACLWRN